MNMKQLLIGLFFILTASISHAQVSMDDLVGKWRVVKEIEMDGKKVVSQSPIRAEIADTYVFRKDGKVVVSNPAKAKIGHKPEVFTYKFFLKKLLLKRESSVWADYKVKQDEDGKQMTFRTKTVFGKDMIWELKRQ